LQEGKVVASTVYDMSSEPGENYYAAQYLRSLERFTNGVSRFGRIVDFGCGQGRLTIPIALKFPSSEVIGVDISKAALNDAVIGSLKAGVTNVTFVNSAIDDYLNQQMEFPIDLAFFTEVGFYLPNWKEDISKIFTIMAPGGLLLASFRSTYFTLMLQLRQRNFQSALQILSSDEGLGRVTPDDDLIFTWINSVDLKKFCLSHGMLVLDMFGIGTASGIQGDIFDDFAQPGLLLDDELDVLEAIENRFAHLIPDAGRYITVVLQKPPN
jgi:SAM-dependent methyltransferase